MTDTYYLAMKLLRTPVIATPAGEVPLKLPPGCVGLVMAFESREAAAKAGHDMVQAFVATGEEDGND